MGGWNRQYTYLNLHHSHGAGNPLADYVGEREDTPDTTYCLAMRMRGHHTV